MFRGIASLLSKAARLAVPYVSKAVRLRQSVESVRRRVGAAIAGVKPEAIEAIARGEREAERRTAEVVAGDLSTPIDPERLPEPITRQRNRFAWRIRVQYIDPNTGAIRERFVTRSTDEVLSPEQVLSDNRSMLFDEYGVEDQSIMNQEIVQITGARADQRL